MTRTRKLPPLWLIGMTNMTFGMYGGFIGILLPQLLSDEGLPEAKVAAITAAVFTPYFWIFLLSPILDVRFSRRTYSLVLALLTAAAMVVGIINLHRLAIFEVTLIFGTATSFLYSSALFGWLSSALPKRDDVQLSAWLNVANIGAGGLMVVIASQLIRRLPLGMAAAILGLLLLAPTLIFPLLPAPGPDRRLAKESFAGFFREIGLLLKRREVLIALALFLLPAGSFSLTNVLTGLGNDFHTSSQVVSLVAGFGGIVAGVGGSLLYPLLAKGRRLRPLYLGIGIAGAAFTLLMAALPHDAWIFATALLGETALQSLAITAAFAIQFETIGESNPLAATFFATMGAAVNFSITYMIWVDGFGHSFHGATGSLLTDAGCGLIACAVLWVVLRIFGMSKRKALTVVDVSA